MLRRYGKAIGEGIRMSLTGERPKQYPKRWMLGAVRRRQIFRIVEVRRSAGSQNPARSTMIVGCDCLADLEGWPVPPSGNPHLGLHPALAMQLAQDLGLNANDDLIDEVIEIVASVRKRGGNLSSDEAGRYLALTRSEREAARAWLIDAAEEPRDRRMARKAIEKRERDRERNRLKRADRRAAKGLPPIGAPTLKDEAPWRALGISERTWHRRQKRERNMRGSNPSPTYVAVDNGSNPSRTFEDTDRRRLTATTAQIEARMLAFLGEGSVERGRRVAVHLMPGTVAAWAYLLNEGVMTNEQIGRAEAALEAARSTADESVRVRGAA